jgi:hypothetical protein
MDKVGFRRFIAGAFPARYAFPYLILVYATFTGLILISDSLYPDDYSFFTNSVSNLGDPLLNPFPGWLFFSMALWSFGFLAIPIFLYQSRRLMTGQRHHAILFLLLSLVACAGSIAVGFFTEVAETFGAHVVSAVMAFGGLFFAAIVSWVPCFVGAVRSSPRPVRNARLAITVVQMIVVASIATVTGTVFAQEEISGIVGVGFLSITFWEWMLLFCIGIHAFLLTINVNLGSK